MLACGGRLCRPLSAQRIDPVPPDGAEPLNASAARDPLLALDSFDIDGKKL